MYHIGIFVGSLAEKFCQRAVSKKLDWLRMSATPRPELARQRQQLASISLTITQTTRDDAL